MRNNIIKSSLFGIAGAFAMAGFYVLVLFLITKSLTHPFEQFVQYKIWFTLIIAGFGVQMGLFWYVRLRNKKTAGSALAASAGASGVAMVACCTHHIFDLLPIIGLSSLALVMAKYQTYLFLVSVIANLLGIAYMVYIVRTGKCPSLKLIFNNLFNNDNMKNIMIIVLVGAVLFLAGIMLFNNKSEQNELKQPVGSEEAKSLKKPDSSIQKKMQYAQKISEGANVAAEAIPKELNLSKGNNIFKISINTHSVDLSYDFKSISKLSDDMGNVYSAMEWTGNSGWHHINGDLIFGPIKPGAKKLKLLMSGVADIDRTFEWNL